MERRDLAKIFHRTAGRAIAEVRGRVASQKLKELKPGEHYLDAPPYIGQLAGAKPGAVSGRYKFINDEEAAKRFGTDLEAFNHWAWNACGVACVQMILKQADKDFSMSTMDLVKEGLKLGGYDEEGDIGWFHEALVTLSKKHGVNAETRKFISSQDIALMILEKRYVLASVASQRDGHLLLVYGFSLDDSGRLNSFIAHDPFDFRKRGESKELKAEVFEKRFTRRVIVVGWSNGD